MRFIPSHKGILPYLITSPGDKVILELEGLSPEQRFSQYILNDMQQGFHIGVDCTHLQVQRATRNLRSVAQNHQIVEQHICEETDAFRLLGP